VAATDDEITQLLTAIQGGDKDAETRLVALVYGDFHAIAARHMSKERSDPTLQPTALITRPV
jgi:hypothetical protein